MSRTVKEWWADQKIGEKATDAWKWAKSKAPGAGRVLGVLALVGLGLLAIAVVVGFVIKKAGQLISFAGKIFTWNPVGNDPGFERITSTAIEVVSLIAIVGIVISVLILLLLFGSMLIPMPKPVDATANPLNDLERRLARLRAKSFHWSVIMTTPENHSRVLFWWFFGIRGISRIMDAGIFKWPLFEIGRLFDRRRWDATLKTNQLPAGTIKPRVTSRDKTVGSAEASRETLQEQRRPIVGGTISYSFRLSLYFPHRQLRKLIESGSEYWDRGSKAVEERIQELAATRARQVLTRIPFEDTFAVPHRVLLLGTDEDVIGRSVDEDVELYGWERWKHIDVNEAPFNLALTDEDAVQQFVSRRPECLLAQIWSQGVGCAVFTISDVNPPADLEKKLQDRLNAEIERDAELTRWLSKIADKAKAESDAGNTLATMAMNNLGLNVDKLAELSQKVKDGKLDLSDAKLLWLLAMLEDRRTKRLMEGRYTEVDVGGMPTSLRSLFADVFSAK